VFAQQSLQLKLSRWRYASVMYALQNNTVLRSVQNWVIVSDVSSASGARTETPNNNNNNKKLISKAISKAPYMESNSRTAAHVRDDCQ